MSIRLQVYPCSLPWHLGEEQGRRRMQEGVCQAGAAAGAAAQQHNPSAGMQRDQSRPGGRAHQGSVEDVGPGA